MSMYSFESSADAYSSTFPIGPNFDSIASISLEFDVSAVECTIRWHHNQLIDDGTFKNVLYKLEIFSTEEHIHVEVPKSESFHRMATVPGMKYSVLIICIADMDEELARGKGTFKAVFNKAEMTKMYEKAVGNVQGTLRPFFALYRCKPKSYFDVIHKEKSGLMEPCTKDDNGQAASPINGAIKGIFFSCRLLPDGSIPESSPFGEVRMIIPAFHLLNPEIMNFYFSDYYCNYSTHYITVVVCLKGSETDLFCQKKLVSLPDENPFLRIERLPNTDQSTPLGYRYKFSMNQSIWVEIYFTEAVPLTMGKFSLISTTGSGSSKIGGLRHNKECTVCNLYPVEKEFPFDVEKRLKNEEKMECEDLNGGEVRDTVDNLTERFETLNGLFSDKQTGS